MYVAPSHGNDNRLSAPLTARDRDARRIAAWREFSLSDEIDDSRSPGFVTKVSTARFALVVFLLASIFTLYITHVYATQDVLDELQALRRENLRLHLQHNTLTGAFDHVTGPSVVYQRAAEIGLEEGIVYGPTVTVEATTSGEFTTH